MDRRTKDDHWLPGRLHYRNELSRTLDRHELLLLLLRRQRAHQTKAIGVAIAIGSHGILLDRGSPLVEEVLVVGVEVLVRRTALRLGHAMTISRHFPVPIG